jgi:hypothetical protein
MKEEDLKELKIKKCPCCGSPAHVEDLTKNKLGHKNIVYGRIVCDNNTKGTEGRCYIKTVCGEFNKVLTSWNNRPNK